MYDFYPREVRAEAGFIQLESGQSNLFTNLPPGVSSFLLLEQEGSPEVPLDIDYNVVSRTITFDLPAAQLNHEKVYRLTLVQEDASKVRKELLAPIHFRVSNFDKFNEKLAAMESSSGPWDNNPLSFNMSMVQKSLVGDARIGQVAHTGGATGDPLVRFAADLDNPYYANIDRIINRGFPYTPSASGCPEFTVVGETGIPEFYDAAGVVLRNLSAAKITADDFGVGTATFTSDDDQTLSYRVPQEANERFQVLQSKISACVEEVTTGLTGESLTAEELDARIKTAIGDRAYRFMQEEGLPDVPEGVYRIRASYTLPDGRVTTPGWPIEIYFQEPSGGGLGSN